MLAREAREKDAVCEPELVICGAVYGAPVKA